MNPWSIASKEHLDQLESNHILKAMIKQQCNYSKIRFCTSRGILPIATGTPFCKVRLFNLF
jgi:hypothetical protein